MGSQCISFRAGVCREPLGRGVRLGCSHGQDLKGVPHTLSAGHIGYLVHLNRSLGGVSLAPNMLVVDQQKPQGGQA